MFAFSLCEKGKLATKRSEVEAPNGFFGYCEAVPLLLIRMPFIIDLGPPRTSVPTVKREKIDA